ncbi:MAG: DUF2099 family protein [Actinobacteria bacterium]|nr:DUF2099 family protein [Actinomycetota bacterium]
MISRKVEKFHKVIRDQHGSISNDLHITRKAGALVAISSGRVIAMEEPVVKYCPLFKALFSSGELTGSSIEERFIKQAREYGMFKPGRKVIDGKITVPFGASEMMMFALKRDIVDTAVVACEGTGTVMVHVPEVVQGIGAYMNGIFYTSPIPGVIERPLPLI